MSLEKSTEQTERLRGALVSEIPAGERRERKTLPGKLQRGREPGADWPRRRGSRDVGRRVTSHDACSVLSNPSDRWCGAERLDSRSRVIPCTHSESGHSREEHAPSSKRLTLRGARSVACPPHPWEGTRRGDTRYVARARVVLLRTAQLGPQPVVTTVQIVQIAVTCTHVHPCVAARRCSSPPRAQFLRCVPRIRATHPGDSAAKEVR